MAFTDHSIKKLFFKEHLIGVIYDCHTGLGWTTGKFRLETKNNTLIAFINDYATLDDIWGEDMQKWEEEMEVLSLKYGVEYVSPENWSLIQAENNVRISLILISFIDNENEIITLKTNGE